MGHHEQHQAGGSVQTGGTHQGSRADRGVPAHAAGAAHVSRYKQAATGYHDDWVMALAIGVTNIRFATRFVERLPVINPNQGTWRAATRSGRMGRSRRLTGCRCLGSVRE